MPQVTALREENGAGRVDDDDVDVTIVPSELLELFLPSNLPDDLRNGSSLSAVKSREVRLRIAQSKDSLSTMRRRLCVLSEVFKFKDKQFSGQGNKINTRARSIYTRFRKKVDHMAARYRRARAALVRIDPQGSWRTSILPLLESDVRPMRSNDDTLGEGDFVLSWIWRRAPSGDTDVPHDSVRVEWAKMKARVERWDEEASLLVEEMRRVVMFLQWKSSWWSSHATSRATGEARFLDGASAYAHRQADNFRYLSTSYMHLWAPVLDKLDIPRPWPKEVEPVSSILEVRIGSLTQMFPKRKSSQGKGAGKQARASVQVVPGQASGGETICDRPSRSVVLRVISPEEVERRGLPRPGFNLPHRQLPDHQLL